MKNKKKDKSVARRTMHYYWQELKKHKWLLFLTLFFTPVSVIGFSYAAPFFTAEIIDTVSAGGIDGSNPLISVAPCIIGIALSFALSHLTLRIRIWAIWKMELQAMYSLSLNVFHKLSEQSMSFHNNRFGGSLVSQTGKYVGSFERLLDVVVFDLIPILFQIVLSFVFLLVIMPPFALVFLIFIIAYTIVAWIFFRKITPLNEEVASVENKQSGQLADSVSNILTVKSYGREKYERERYKNVSESVFKSNIKLMNMSNLRDSLFSILATTVMVAMAIFISGGNVWFGISIGSLLLIWSYSNTVLSNIWDINHVFKHISRAFGDAHEMTKILDLPNSVDDKIGAKPLKVKTGEIDFDKVSFKYAEDKNTLFADMDLVIKSGQRLGLVGRSGGGKTTLTKLLLRFADIDKGQITIDGQDISDVTQESLRNNIAYVPQETTLFHRTIAENISYGKPDATREQIINAAKQANAWEFIKDLPKGLDTLTGERGVKLSGGQRQRVAIARAILKNAPILILDEATASLDTESEKLIQEAIARLMKDRTSIVIAHRLSTVAGLDRIIVLDKGKIIEDGSHQELVNKDGVYAKLWNKQTGLLIE